MLRKAAELNLYDDQESYLQSLKQILRLTTPATKNHLRPLVCTPKDPLCTPSQ